MKFITIGEIMMRLSPPNYDKIVSTHDFIVNYGGAEANVAVSLACLGVDSTLFTVLPNTDLGTVSIHISEPTRRTPISYAVFCLKKKKKDISDKSSGRL